MGTTLTLFQVLDTYITMALQVIFATLLAVAAASPLPAAPAPYAAAPPPVDYNLPPVYSYEYGVSDPEYKTAFSQKESRKDYETAGEYRVNLPDGRVQIVSYTANADGYVADVRYEGDAVYPEYVPKAVPAYKPIAAPAYKPAPAPAYVPAAHAHHAAHVAHANHAAHVAHANHAAHANHVAHANHAAHIAHRTHAAHVAAHSPIYHPV